MIPLAILVAALAVPLWLKTRRPGPPRIRRHNQRARGPVAPCGAALNFSHYMRGDCPTCEAWKATRPPTQPLGGHP